MRAPEAPPQVGLGRGSNGRCGERHTLSVAAKAGRPSPRGLLAPLNYPSLITATPCPSKPEVKACHQPAVIRDRVGRRRLPTRPPSVADHEEIDECAAF